MPIISIHNQAEFDAQLSSAGQRLVVADFTASWCGPCKQIAPHFTALSNTHAANAIFLKVDIDEARDVAQAFNVTAVPTFIFFKNGQRIQNLRGCDSNILESKINEFISKKEGGSGEQPQKHGDLAPFISKQDSECLNENDDHCLSKLLAGESYIESDCDEQLLISIGFSQPVKLHSLRLTGPKNAPKTVCIYMNQPHTLDFDSAASMKPVQMLELESKDTEKDAEIKLKYVKFQNVSNIQLFVKDNQEGSDVTRIDELQFFGTPLCSTNMNDFKRVSGHKGEVH